MAANICLTRSAFSALACGFCARSPWDHATAGGVGPGSVAVGSGCVAYSGINRRGCYAVERRCNAEGSRRRWFDGLDQNRKGIRR